MRSLVALSLFVWIAPAAAETPGEKALKSTFYQNTLPGSVELMKQMKKDLLSSMEGPADQRAILERAIDEGWSEEVLTGLVAKAIEKDMSKADLDRAFKGLTPSLQAMVQEGLLPPDPNVNPQDLLWEALKQPEAEAREVAMLKIVPFLPNGESFRALATELVEMLCDVAFLATGSDAKRPELQKAYWSSLEPSIQAMNNTDSTLKGGLIAYRKRSLADLRALADAMQSPAVAKLQKAAAAAVITGAKEARRVAILHLHAELAKANPPKADEKADKPAKPTKPEKKKK